MKLFTFSGLVAPGRRKEGKMKSGVSLITVDQTCGGCRISELSEVAKAEAAIH